MLETGPVQQTLPFFFKFFTLGKSDMLLKICLFSVWHLFYFLYFSENLGNICLNYCNTIVGGAFLRITPKVKVNLKNDISKTFFRINFNILTLSILES